MKFPVAAIDVARDRQDRNDGLGVSCARCCRRIKSIIPIASIEWYAIPRIPVEQGGRKADNCVIVCPDCYREIGQDGTKTIPLSELPCYEVF
jgi:hypothetical protein